jgi:hypothetical protein
MQEVHTWVGEGFSDREPTKAIITLASFLEDFEKAVETLKVCRVV